MKRRKKRRKLRKMKSEERRSTSHERKKKRRRLEMRARILQAIEESSDDEGIKVADGHCYAFVSVHMMCTLSAMSKVSYGMCRR
ncbi:hypothetical protein DPMN_143517 [Dreissena polymorpha]|uniref:Uncharacterized protein n=1 Tax=Dreissena polymorpha TaxID=45954 RepID=A0A9D4JNA3_DREPO|nr:hypothetical protein DPMN_143517 [Dreissena polymorpha]